MLLNLINPSSLNNMSDRVNDTVKPRRRNNRAAIIYLTDKAVIKLSNTVLAMFIVIATNISRNGLPLRMLLPHAM